MSGPNDQTSDRPVLPEPDVTRVLPRDAQDTSAARSTEIRVTGEINLGPPLSAGDIGTLGPYRVVRELGRGGMGSVYLAIDTRLDRKLALKVMLPQLAADPVASQRFLREARATAKVTNDNVVTVYEADERDGVTYIAMQFLQGYPLDEYLRKKGRPGISQIIRIGRETASGLAAAHKTGLIHRDIKPANLWLEAPKGRVKVLDFGLAKPVDGDVEVSQSGMILGTPAYMSPEQARGLKLDGRSDVFSLGGVLYYLCTGRFPFEGPTPMAVLTALAVDEPPPVRELNPAVPPPLADLIHQMLAKIPDKRPRSADDVVQRLRKIAEDLAQSAATMSLTALPDRDPFADLDMTAVVPFTVATTAPVTSEPVSKWVWVAGGAVATALLFLVVLILTTRVVGLWAK
ncbi:MAG: serine/threonine-protein kinase [Pirellulaceae bacterium]